MTDGFVMTGTAQDILRSLCLVRSVACGALTMVAAVPGAGKTRTTWHCKCTARRVIYHAAVAAEGNVRGVAGALMEVVDTGEPDSRRLRVDRRRIAAEIGPEALLILDEAQ